MLHLINLIFKYTLTLRLKDKMACSSQSQDLSVDNYISFAEELLKKCQEFTNIEGASKLGRKIGSEIKFLKSLKTKSQEKIKSHLKSSNLSHYAGILHAVQYLPGVIQVLQPFTSPKKSSSLIVDIVAGEGHVWVKVIARKAQALHLVWSGKGQFGEKDLIEQAEEYVDCKRMHPVNFLEPQIYFVFYNNVTYQISYELEAKDIKVFGYKIDVEDDIKLKLKSTDPFESISHLKEKKIRSCIEKFSDNGICVMIELLGVLPDLDECCVSLNQVHQHIATIKKVNLDITTLIALVSSVTHGGCNYIFKESILSQQAQEEREQACVPIIDNFIKGKELYVCKSALEDFKTILETIGGDGEKFRAKQLLQSLFIIEDCPSPRTLQLEMFGKVKDRSRVIFGTGDYIKAVTVTANSGFVRAARNQGVRFCVYVHPARALTELKEITATAIN